MPAALAVAIENTGTANPARKGLLHELVLINNIAWLLRRLPVFAIASLGS